MNKKADPTDDARQKLAIKSFKNIWLAPTMSFVVIVLVTFSSYLAQTDAAKHQAGEKRDVIQNEAKVSIQNRLIKIENSGIDAAKLYNGDADNFESALKDYVVKNEISSKFKEVAFLSFVPSKRDAVNENKVQFLYPPSKNASQGTSTDLLVGSSVSYITNLEKEIASSAKSGDPSLSLPFVNNTLLEGESTYLATVIPVFEKLPVNATSEQKANAFRGSIVIPISLELFLDSAQESSTNFRIFLILDRESNIIASSNTSAKVADMSLSDGVVQLRNRNFAFEYDNYAGNLDETKASRKSMLITGFGLAFIVFLLFSMMRISEKRSRKLAQKAELEVYESEARFSALIEQSSDITLVLDSEGVVKFASPSVKTNLGYEQIDVIGKNILDIVNRSEARKIALEVLSKLNENSSVSPFEVEVEARNGTIKTFECVINDLRNEEAVSGIVCNSRDISDRKKAEIESTKAKALYEDALENAPIGVTLVHQNGECFFSNEALQEFLGSSTDAIIGSRLRVFVAPDDQFAFSDMWQSLEVRGSDRTTKEMRFTHPDGRTRWGLLSAQGVYDENKFQYYVVQIEDTTERRSIAERLEYQAIHDPLTGLPNRLLFVDRLEVALLRAKRSRLGVAVLFLDLDRFKIVNDSLGHAAGDRLLESVAERIKAAVRPNDTLARFGGDEFVILCEDISDEKQTIEISDRLLESINRPISLVEGEVYVTASIGIARSLDGEDTPETILRDADTAMYRAKDGGRNRAEVFDERTHARAVANLETGNGMFRALEQDEFRVRYQPVVSLASGRLSGFEALVYWQHPDRGHVSPIEFIGLAEETGIIVPLGLKIFEEACNTLHRWHSYSLNASHLTMSINLSPRQLAEPNFVEEVAEILERTGVNVSRVWFEITESALMVDAESTIVMLEQLRNLGVHFEIDDFGTGFSSLSYLKKFPVDALKIDQGFVDGLGRDPEDTAIVTAVISLAHALGLQAIAEGVETPLQMAELKTLGCEYAQGYLLAKPADAENWEHAVRSNDLFTFEDEKTN